MQPLDGALFAAGLRRDHRVAGNVNFGSRGSLKAGKIHVDRAAKPVAGAWPMRGRFGVVNRPRQETGEDRITYDNGQAKKKAALIAPPSRADCGVRLTPPV